MGNRITHDPVLEKIVGNNLPIKSDDLHKNLVDRLFEIHCQNRGTEDLQDISDIDYKSICIDRAKSSGIYDGIVLHILENHFHTFTKEGLLVVKDSESGNILYWDYFNIHKKFNYHGYYRVFGSKQQNDIAYNFFGTKYGYMHIDTTHNKPDKCKSCFFKQIVGKINISIDLYPIEPNKHITTLLKTQYVEKYYEDYTVRKLGVSDKMDKHYYRDGYGSLRNKYKFHIENRMFGIVSAILKYSFDTDIFKSNFVENAIKNYKNLRELDELEKQKIEQDKEKKLITENITKLVIENLKNGNSTIIIDVDTTKIDKSLICSILNRVHGYSCDKFWEHRVTFPDNHHIKITLL